MSHLKVSERYYATKGTMLTLLADLQESGACRQTLYLTPESIRAYTGRTEGHHAEPYSNDLLDIATEIRHSEIGVAVFWRPDTVLTIQPPFPVAQDSLSAGAATSPLVHLLRSQPLIGVVLLRLGRYAVGVLRGEDLVATKTGSRYVKSRHRAGGSSQRRFARSGQRLAREFFDKACEVAKTLFDRLDRQVDYLFLGGERRRLQDFRRRCGYLSTFGPKLMDRVLDVHRPGQQALEGIARQVWKSRVTVFTGNGVQVAPGPTGRYSLHPRQGRRP